MHHLTPRAPPICRKDHPCIERYLRYLSVDDGLLVTLCRPGHAFRRWARSAALVTGASARTVTLPAVSKVVTGRACPRGAIVVMCLPKCGRRDKLS